MNSPSSRAASYRLCLLTGRQADCVPRLADKGRAVLYRLPDSSRNVALVQNVFSRPQARFLRIAPDVPHASGKVLLIPNEPIEVIPLPKRTTAIGKPVDAHGRLSFPRMHNLLQRPLVHWREQCMHMIRHHDERDDVNASCVKMMERRRDLLRAPMAAQKARTMMSVEPFFDPA